MFFEGCELDANIRKRHNERYIQTYQPSVQNPRGSKKSKNTASTRVFAIREFFIYNSYQSNYPPFLFSFPHIMTQDATAPGFRIPQDAEKAIPHLEGVVTEDNMTVAPSPEYAESGDSVTTAQHNGNTNKTASGEEIIYVEFEEKDPRDPLHFSKRRKWILTSIACFATFLSSTGVGGYNMGFESMMRDLNCTEFQATIGLSVYPLGFAVVPMLTASFSEEFGRKPLYLWTTFLFVLTFVMIALAPNIATVIIGRFLQGSFASTGATMVGGTIADIWPVAERGLPMSLFAWYAIFCMGVGPVISGWIEMNPAMQWRWIQWIQMTWSGAYFLVLFFFMDETRSTIVLQKIAKNVRKETGDKRYKALVEVEKPQVRKLIWISCTRPLRLLMTEPIVISFSLWIGFCWGVMFCLIESISGVFTTLHGFNIGQVGTVFISMMIGSMLGIATNFYQEKIYKIKYPVRGTEARLYTACLAAFLLPIGMFMYAWCSFSRIHWIALCIAITIYMWGTFIVYLGVFSYLADCYGPYASSALAGQSLFRNILGTVFPLFTQQMYRRLGYPWANTLFGCLAVALLPIPFVLFYFGPKIRMMSKFSRKVVEARKGELAG